MGGKKKSIANKLAKMSDEERVRYLQHRADIEEEARRKKQQLLSTFMKNKVSKEDAFARLNLAKINQNWLQILRRDKCKQLKESVLYFQEDFARILDNKNRSVTFLLNQIDEAEIQYGYNYQNHIMQIDKIMKTQEEYLNQMKIQYERGCQELFDDFQTETNELYGKYKQDIEYLKVLIYGGEMISKRKIWKQYEYYKSKIFRIIHENSIEMRQLRTSRERSSSALWRQISATVVQYTANADRRRSHLAELHTLDHEGAAEVAKNQATIQRKEAEILKLKKKYAEIVTDGNSQISNLQITLEKVSKKCLNMKIYLNKQLTNDDKRFILLVGKSNDAADYLERVLDKGKQIIQLIDICKKFETIDDAIELTTIENKEQSSKLEDDQAIKEIDEEADKFLMKFDQVTASISSEGSSITSYKTETEGSDHSSAVVLPLVLPSGINETNRSSQSQPRLLQTKISLCDPADNIFDNLKDLDKLWRKYNLVYMNISELKQEQADVMNSSEQYRSLLRQMLGTIIILKNQTKVIATEEVYRRVVKI